MTTEMKMEHWAICGRPQERIHVFTSRSQALAEAEMHEDAKEKTARLARINRQICAGIMADCRAERLEKQTVVWAFVGGFLAGLVVMLLTVLAVWWVTTKGPGTF